MHPVLSLLLPLSAFLFLAASVIGTDRLGRPLSDEERKVFGALLRDHDYPSQRLIALRFAYKLTRSEQRSQDLMARADLRLVRFGWDPAEVALAKRLCRLVWSEWTNERSETAASKKGEDGYLRELEATEGLKVPAGPAPRRSSESKGGAAGGTALATASVEDRAVELEGEQAAQTKASVMLARLRGLFETAKDEVNLLWLKCQLEDVTEPAQMAEASGRPVEDFYAAAKRRRRHVQRLLANERGVDLPEEES